MIVPVAATAELLAAKHYLGPTKTARFAWKDEFGVMVFGSPRGRHLPPAWLELLRWCLIGGPNAGSMQWRVFLRWGSGRSRGYDDRQLFRPVPAPHRRSLPRL